MKLAIISDGHLFQSFIKSYEPLHDFKEVLKEIKQKTESDILLMAGDMFDCKKTPGTYLRHYEGEGLMINVRQTLREFNIPIFSIRGNHEKEEVLEGLDQTVENFHYVRNDWKTFKDLSIYFMDTHFEGDFYEPSIVSEIMEKISPKTESNPKETKLFLCHETFAPFENCLPLKVVKEKKKEFDWIINGHMHFLCESAYGLEKVCTLPALLPSKVVRGKYWIEQYRWKSDDDQPLIKRRDSPFGYAVLDTEKNKIEFCSFSPSRKIVEISIDATRLTLGDVIKRLKNILEIIRKRSDRDSLIILPELHGEANFLTTFLKDILKDYTDLNLEAIRINTTSKIVTPSGKVITPPLLTPQQVFEEIETDIPEIRKKLVKDLEVDVDDKTLKKIFNDIRENEILDKLPPRITLRLENILEIVISELKDLGKPDSFEDDLKSVIQRVKEL